ncbi:CHAT domain-containing protein [Leptolyngbya sp. AN03gr2]|uniref:CHAT domain-containing protein n=1 Tax=unclassified Leptolyngbya TaxID=2650499 RepID=UPI003D3173B9
MRSRFMQFCIFTLIGCCLSGLIQLSAHSQAPSKTASSFNQQGFQALTRGNPTEALSLWRQATHQYEQEQNPEGIAGSRLNQAIALQVLGLNLQACQTIVGTLRFPSWLCVSSPQLQAIPSDASEQLSQQLAKLPQTSTNRIGLRLMGTTLRSLSKLAESKKVLDRADQFAVEAQDKPEQARLALSRGTTNALLSDQLRNNLLRIDDPILQEQDIARLSEAITNTISEYQRAIRLAASKQDPVSGQAAISTFSFVVDLGYWLEHSAEQWAVTRLNPQFTKIVTNLKPTILPLQSQSIDYPSKIETISSQIKLAQSLIKSKQVKQISTLWQSTGSTDAQIQKLIDQSLTSAKAIQNLRFQSLAVGTRGLAIESAQRPNRRAIPHYEEAITLAQAVNAPDLAYQWQQELAQLYRAENRNNDAAAAYRSAIANINEIRASLLAVNPEIQFSFRERVEPVYREYMELLSTQPQPNLQEIVQVNESLQISELENYLGCGRIADITPIEQIVSGSNSPIVVHIINLPDTIKTIVQSGPSTFHEYTSKNPAATKLAAQNLIVNLQDPGFRNTNITEDVLPYAQTLYTELIKPAKDQNVLPANGSLVFVLDSLLQNIPMGLLHDGSQFLIENYQVSLAIGSRVQKPEQLKSNNLRALIAGLSETSPSFQDPRAPRGLTALPEVEFEIKNIRRSLSRSVELLNEQFTANRLFSEVQNEYPIVHITTHGQFSSDPTKTVLLAWDKVIDAAQINQLVRTSTQTGQSAINLLVLSACQTAKGDSRSTLGIAGLAAQASARSTVATLWLVDADSTGVLMSEFYQALNEGLTKTQALQRAQVTLLKSDAFAHPYFWSGIVLVGSPV